MINTICVNPQQIILLVMNCALLVLIIYGADMEDWVKHSRINNYVDDTTSNVKGKSEDELITKLEEDASNILNFTALVASTQKLVEIQNT